MVSQLLWKSCHRLGFWLQFVQMPYGYFWNRSLPGHDGGMSRLPLRAQTFSELLSLVTSAAMYVHVRPRSETIRCYAPVMGNLGGFPICGPLRKNSDSSRQGSPPNDGVLVLRFRPIRRFWRIMSKIAFSTKSWKYHIVCVFDIPCFFVIPRLHRWSTFLQNSRTATTKLSTLVSAIGVLFSKLYFSCEWKNNLQTHRIVASDDEMSVQIIFSAHKKYFHVTMMNTHHVRTWKLFTHHVCSIGWSWHPWCQDPSFCTPAGGCKNGTKTRTGPDGPGGVWKPPPGGPPPGGGAGI